MPATNTLQEFRIKNSKNEFLIFFGAVWLILFFYKIDLVIKNLTNSTYGRGFLLCVFCCLVTVWFINELISRLFGETIFSASNSELTISTGLPFYKISKSYNIRQISAIRIEKVDSSWSSNFGGYNVYDQINALIFNYDNKEVVIGKRISDADLQSIEKWLHNLRK